MARITIQRQCWQRWPRVLIVERHNDDGTVEERRYVPEGGTTDEWNERTRDVMRKFEAARKELDARLHEESELPNLRAEIDGLKWAIEDRDELIRDLMRLLPCASRAFRAEAEARICEMGIGGIE